jgi:hypothetical protein
MDAQFSSDLSSEELLERARDDHQHGCEILSRYSSSPEDVLRDLGGPRIPSLKDSFHALIEAFDDWDSQIRITALLLAKDHWPQLEELTPICLRLACEDPVPTVRGIALDTLMKYYGWIKDSSGLLWEMMFCCQDSTAAQLVRTLKNSCMNQGKDVRYRREHWRDLIGDLVDQMLCDRAVAEAHLTDPNPDIQHVALGMMAQEWKPTKTAADFAENFITDEIDETRYAIALIVIAKYYEGSNDGRIGKLFAKILRDTTRPLKLRRTSYLALYRIRGTRPRKLPDPRALVDDTRFSDQVDWQFVSSFD